jgi:hypothetical protein
VDAFIEADTTQDYAAAEQLMFPDLPNPFCLLGGDHIEVVASIRRLPAFERNDTVTVPVEYRQLGLAISGALGAGLSVQFLVDTIPYHVTVDSSGTARIVCDGPETVHVGIGFFEESWVPYLDDDDIGEWQEALDRARRIGWLAR